MKIRIVCGKNSTGRSLLERSIQDVSRVLVRIGALVDVVSVPTSEPSTSTDAPVVIVPLLSREEQERIEAWGHRFVGSNCRARSVAEDKSQYAKLCASASVAAPRTVVVLPTASSLRQLADDAGISYPYIVKPAEGYMSDGINLVRSPADAVAAQDYIRTSGEPWLAQEFL